MFKRILIALLICLSLNGYSQNLKATWKKTPDDVKHVYAGLIISTASGLITYRLTDARTGWAVLAAFTTGVGAGIAKEVIYDGMMHKGTVSNRDAFNTAWGSLWGTINVRIIIDVREKRIDEQYEAMEKYKNLAPPTQ